MRGRRVLAAGILGLVLATGARAAGPDPAAADAAFDAGDNAKALALYDEVLAASPNDVHVLLRSGMLLSWERKYDQALERDAKALAIVPGNTKVKLERGKVLLWSSRYDEARPVLESVLAADPKEVWAALGIAQSYAWTGHSAESLPYYRKALAIQPDLKEARIGLANAQLATGDTAAAEKAAQALAKEFPDDKDVQELNRAVRRASAPWISIGYDHISDSDDNRMDTWRLEGGLNLPSRFDLRFGLARAEVHGPIPPAGLGGNGTSEALYGVVGWRPRPDVRGELRLGADRLTDSSGDTRTTAIGGISATFPMASWTGRAGVQRDPFLYSPEILDNRIDVTTVSFGATGNAAKRIRVDTNAAYGDLSDGNTRIGIDAGAWWVWKWLKRSLQLGPAVRFLDYSEDLSHGYFDPSALRALLASLRSEGVIDASAWSYEATAEAGVQSYTFHGADASDRPLVNLYGALSRGLPHGIGLALYAGWGNSSTAAGPGFHSVNAGARLRFAIGGE